MILSFNEGVSLLNQVIGMIYMMGRLVREMSRHRENFMAVTYYYGNSYNLDDGWISFRLKPRFGPR